MFDSLLELAVREPIAARVAVAAFVAVLVVVVCVAWDSRGRRGQRLEYGGSKLGYSTGKRRHNKRAERCQ